MKIKHTNLFYLIILVYITVGCYVPANAEDIHWKSYDEGVAIAKEKQMKIVIFFHSDKNIYSKQMINTTFKDEEIIRHLNEHYISILADYDNDKDLFSLYKIKAIPTTIFLKANLVIIESRIGYIDLEAFIDILKRLNTNTPKYIPGTILLLLDD